MKSLFITRIARRGFFTRQQILDCINEVKNESGLHRG